MILAVTAKSVGREIHKSVGKPVSLFTFVPHMLSMSKKVYENVYLDIVNNDRDLYVNQAKNATF